MIVAVTYIERDNFLTSGSRSKEMIVNQFISILIPLLSGLPSHSYDIANTKQSQRMSYEWGEGKHNTVTMDGHLQCSNNSACPTWFVCE